ncbi:uncharacterized protein LOC122528435 [Frieseomelitta varia]|uniref:uncharacterized protein LOC122528435 n=1 Tax=Frieseomelitta varia TaxID=561572 RepID=UPI001CB68885|nr:uncharacterized protein LOC122528435 [Frieseomelitta varia]
METVFTTIVCLTLLLGPTFVVFSLVENNTCTFQMLSLQTSNTVLIANTNITYGLLLVKSVNVEKWLENIKRDWNHIQDKEEFKTYVGMGNRYINIYLSKK